MFRYLSVAIYCILLLCWSQQTDANDLLTNATTNGILIDQQLEQNNEQNRYVISGFVVDIESAESLVGATVYASEMGIGTTTNRYGFFSLSVAADSVRLVVSHVGYLTLTLNQTLTEDLQLNIELQPEATRLDEVEVVAVGESSVEAIQMSQIKLPVATIRALPVLAGETDVFKTLQLLPGVQSGREGTAGLYVRGGSPDQNLVLLDGVTVYNPNHLYGFLSVFNSDAIKDVTLIKGGMPARYGGRLSSVIDLTMEEGNMREFEGTASVGIIGSSFTFQGPIKKDRASFIVAARRTYLDLLVYPFLDEDEKAGYYFYDASAKINYITSSKDRVYLSIHAGRDRAYARGRSDQVSLWTQDRSEFGWRNLTATARWNRIWGAKFFSNTLLGYTRYRAGTRSQQESGPLDDRSDIQSFYRNSYVSGITDIIGRMEFDWVPNPVHYLRFGLGGTVHAYNTGTLSEREFGVDIAPVDTVYNPGHKIRALEIHTYVEDEVRLSSDLSLNAGVRASSFFVRGRRYHSFQPRFNVRWKFSANLAFKTSYALLKQNSHLLPVANGLSLPLDLWVPATDQVRPQSATQVASGFAWNSPQRAYEVTIEGFYKWMNSQIEYAEGAQINNLTGDSWQDRIESGKGWSYGGELFVRKSTGRITGWIGYSLTKTRRKFPALNDGRTFPFRFDRLHDVSVAASWQLSQSIGLSAVWVYGTGQAVWLPVGHFYGFQHDPGGSFNVFEPEKSRLLTAFGDRNSVRMRAYHRLDLSMQVKRDRRWAYRTFSFGVYNAYSRRNPFLLYTKNPSDENGNALNYLIFQQVSAFPVIPFANYRLEF
ncbi:MAG: TonB-dependent receptor plug domain-containing protein [Rhodothermaceae bacterium]|nr:TonB-dependent receptor plug domain-containing protein [Rhodothermaceae bacterium]MYC03881.1 TonB-dependent receptor plug domain-containing protein [Rhodothermaceae bacterium]MYI16633.1 TonB-dependent receptor plug domain-containing protein [Rhodothermaceae bacterium]